METVTFGYHDNDVRLYFAFWIKSLLCEQMLDDMERLCMNVRVRNLPRPIPLIGKLVLVCQQVNEEK